MHQQAAHGGASATIDLAALRANASFARELARGRELIAVVKADAYGHGALPVAREVLAAGATRLAVMTTDEAQELRSGGIAAPLLVLGGARDQGEAAALLALHAAAVVHDEASLARMAEAARRAGRRAAVQVEIDTGMRRLGIAWPQAPDFVAAVAASDALALEGVFTHFACADAPDPAASLEQIERLRGVLRALRERGIDPGHVHAANSAALLAEALQQALPEATAVRPGLLLYGVRPAPHLDPGGRLRPVMTLRAPVLHVHVVRAGESVGYGASWRAPRDTRVATIGLGYADGLPWSAGNRGAVWLEGALRPIRGRVSMDSVCVEIGPDARVAPGAPAVVFGAAPDPSLRVEGVAEAAGTLSYELLVRPGRRVARRHTGGAADPPARSPSVPR